MRTAPSLRELQQWLRWTFTDPRGVNAALAEPRPTWPARAVRERYRAPRPDCLGLVADVAPISRPERLSIYAEAYFGRIHESLGSDFPALARALGEERFMRVCADYLKEHPSRFADIGQVGRALPAFLAKRERPWIAELARLEAAVIESFYSAESEPLDPARLEEIAPRDWPRARITLDPSARLLELSFPVDRVWASSTGKPRAPRPARTQVLVHRHASGNVGVERLEGAQFAALSALARGSRLAYACRCAERAAKPERLPETSISTWFAGWVAGGLIRGVDT